MGVVKRKDENIIDSRMVKNIMYQDKAPKVQMCFVQSLKTYYAFKTIEDYLCEVFFNYGFSVRFNMKYCFAYYFFM